MTAQHHPQAAEPLKNCPFCGGQAKNVSAGVAGPSNRLHAGDSIFAVNCSNCGGSVPNRYRNDLVVEAWNTRTTPVVAQEGAALAAGWMPIETAPKDGTCIVLARPGYAASGYWGESCYNGMQWMAGEYILAMSTFNPPMHWCSLPAPPVVRADAPEAKS